MNGTEKQVKWAEDIKAKMLVKVEEYRQQLIAEAAKHNVSLDSADGRNALGMFDRCVAKINAQASATWFIDNRSAVISKQWIKEMGK